jgi:hypothetical protein
LKDHPAVAQQGESHLRMSEGLNAHSLFNVAEFCILAAQKLSPRWHVEK